MKSKWLACLPTALLCCLLVGCGSNPPAPDGDQVLGDDPPAIDDNPPATGGDDSPTDTVSALSFDGTLSGFVAEASSTDASLESPSARLANALEVAAAATAWLTDVEGNRLKDAQGNEYPDFVVNLDGTFDLAGLPVGVDMVVNVDIDGDGIADVQTIVNIPADAGATSGALEDVVVDPLSTLSYAKLLLLLQEAGVDSSQLDLSFAALIERVRDAFENLSGDSGIDARIDLESIRGLTPEQLAVLFDAAVPEGAQRGMRMFRGNIALAVASDVEGVVKAVAPILLEGGFAIADEPAGVDLSFLQSLPNVTTMTFQQYNELQNPGAQQAPPPPGFVEPTLYVNNVAEPNRNYASAGDVEESKSQGPIFSEHALIRMAEAYLAGKTITLGQLYELLVDADTGLAVRLTYGRFMGPGSPPVNVFETEDGAGTERDLQGLFMQINALGLNVPDPQTFEARQAQLRQLLAAFLDGTAEPSFERLFGGLLMARVPSADEVARFLREKRAHLPFSRTGPAQLYVVATADSFNSQSAQPVRVSVDVDAQGVVQKVRADSAGKFYVMFGPQTEEGMLAGLVNATNGRMLHDYRGAPQFVEIADGAIFEDVEGESFLEAFSEQGNNYPGSPELSVTNWGFDPNQPEDPETNPRNFQIYVLMTEPGPDGVPVRVDYQNDTATFNPDAGAYYLMFDPETINGKFALVQETGEMLMTTPGDWNTRVLVEVADVQGLPPMDTGFVHIFGMSVANPAYDPAGAPYFDDVNENGEEDAGEPTFSERHFLNDPNEWRSTYVEQYYRKASDNGFPNAQEIDWGSDTPQMQDGDPLVPRNFRPRANAFLFGRPNVAVNLLMAFNPPEFFDGTHALNADTPLNPFTVLALVNLVFDSVQNVEALVDFDGPAGPMPAHNELIDAHFFVPPVGDPVQLMVNGFGQLVGP